MANEDPDPRASLAEFYDSTDTADGIRDTAVEVDVVADPMVTTSLRLPKSVLDELREVAARHGTKPTALIRRLVESGLTRPAGLGLDEAALLARTVVEDARAAAEELVLRVRQETRELHLRMLADLALVTGRPDGDRSAGAAGDVVIRAAERALALIEDARADVARMRLDAERDLASLLEQRDAVARQVREARDVLAAGSSAARRAG